MNLGAGWWRGRLPPAGLMLWGPSAGTEYAVADRQRYLVLAIPFALFRPAIGEIRPGFTDFGRLHAAPFQDAFVEALCRRMWDEAAEGGPLGSLFAECAALALAASLLRKAEAAPPPPARRGGLAPFRLRRVEALMRDRLADDLTLGDLAGAAGLSPFHFARAFKAETGLSPHRWLVEQRVGRAKHLLAATDLGIADVALACGFATQAGLSAAFRRAAGTTPGRFRGDARA